MNRCAVCRKFKPWDQLMPGGNIQEIMEADVWYECADCFAQYPDLEIQKW